MIDIEIATEHILASEDPETAVHRLTLALAAAWEEGASNVARAAVILGAPDDLPERSLYHNPYQKQAND